MSNTPTTQADGSITIPVAQATPPARTYTQAELDAMLADARKEEKDKLYERLNGVTSKNDALENAQTTMQEQLARLTAERETRERTANEAAAAAAKAQRDAELAELSVAERLAAVQAEFDQRFNDAENRWASQFQNQSAEIARRDALLEQEQRFAAVSAYRQEQIDKIIAADEPFFPELLTHIGGATPEEVDSSILAFRATSESILRNMQEAAAPQPAAFTPGVRVTAPTAPSLENITQATETFTTERIAAMSPQEYAQHRPALLRAARPPQY